MKLSTETYKNGMKILSIQYLDWKFDLTNKDMVSGWYTTLSSLICEEDFLNAIAYYCQTRAKGPNSPVALQEALAENVPQMSALEGLNTLKGLLNLFQLDHDNKRLVSTLAATESMKALYLTYCNISDIEDNHGFPNSDLKHKLEDSYFCTLFITEYKKIQASVLREACRQPIIALPSGNQYLMIGG